ncbi:MAG: hypothetical protein K0S83_277, partial [Thermomicrobiales bacterium]|nr:hypothetical protein [Thermomicrobiales bacterium]
DFGRSIWHGTHGENRCVHSDTDASMTNLPPSSSRLHSLNRQQLVRGVLKVRYETR